MVLILKKFILFWLIALQLVLPVKAAAPASGAQSMILFHGPDGRVLASHNADRRLPMASTTKIMTALLALEHCAMEDEVEIKTREQMDKLVKQLMRKTDVIDVFRA